MIFKQRMGHVGGNVHCTLYIVLYIYCTVSTNSDKFLNILGGSDSNLDMYLEKLPNTVYKFETYKFWKNYLIYKIDQLPPNI